MCAFFEKNFYGSDNFIKGIDRVCIWIDERNLEDAKNIDEIQRRLKLVSQARSESKDSGARRIADVPWKFREQVTGAAVVVPSITSDNRDYIPVGFVDNNSIVSNTMYTLYGAEIWILALLISRVHMSWVNMVAGRFETRYIYTNTIVYNNFPVPYLSDNTKSKLTQATLRVLDVREYHCEKTLAELYDPEKMPADLLHAHQTVDDMVDSIYSTKTFETDEERLTVLFDLYEKMVEEEKAQLAEAKAKKPTTRRKRVTSAPSSLSLSNSETSKEA